MRYKELERWKNKAEKRGERKWREHEKKMRERERMKEPENHDS